MGHTPVNCTCMFNFCFGGPNSTLDACLKWGNLWALKVSFVVAVTIAPVSIYGTSINPSKTVTVHADVALLFTAFRIAESGFTFGAVLFVKKYFAL